MADRPLAAVHYDFTGSVVLVTGGARGQGLAHAVAFSQAGADVVVFDRADAVADGIAYRLSGAEDLEAAQRRLSGGPARSAVWGVDIRSEDAVATAVARMVDKFGRIDVLVNNAGVNAVASLEATTAALWNAVVDVNLFGALVCCRQVAPIMRERGGGRIVNVASMAALLGVPNQAAYAASKSGLLGLTRALAVELGPSNVRVNAVCPTLVASPQTAGLARANPSRLSGSAGLPYVLPGLTALQPIDVTAAVMWLASDAARWVTGISLVVDGGLSLK